MAGYRIYLIDGARQELLADRCRRAGTRYVFERENTSGSWRVIHEVDVADVAQLQDGVDVDDRSHT